MLPFVPDVSLHPTVYLDLCRTDIILRNASETFGSCHAALSVWKAHAEAVFDDWVRRATRDYLGPYQVIVGRPPSHIFRGAILPDQIMQGIAHAKLHPWPLDWFRADAWFDGREVHLSGTLASFYTNDRDDAFRYIIAHERAHATETTEEGCDRVAERAVRLSDRSRKWIALIRSQKDS